jgi:hypothetical protein
MQQRKLIEMSLKLHRQKHGQSITLIVMEQSVQVTVYNIMNEINIKPHELRSALIRNCSISILGETLHALGSKSMRLLLKLSVT